MEGDFISIIIKVFNYVVNNKISRIDEFRIDYIWLDVALMGCSGSALLCVWVELLIIEGFDEFMNCWLKVCLNSLCTCLGC